MKPFVLCLSVLVLALTPANLAAQTIQDLLARIERLERRVVELEGKSTTTPAAVAAVAPEQVAQVPTGESAPPEFPSLHMAGFSDINFSATDQRGVRSGFNEGQFTLHLTSPLSPRVTYFGEITLAARGDAGTGTPAATGFNAEVERSIIRFDHSDRLKVSFGRYHTPINYWNTAFHHGQWLQTSVSRPEMTQFGGRFIPVHFVGGLVEGAIPSGGLNVNYGVGLGNGRGSVISRGGDAGDANNNRAWLANVFVKPDALYGLQAGVSVYRDKISTGGRNFNEWITTAHVVWNRENPEIVAEAANVNHNEVNRPGVHWNSQAYYIQAAYRLPDMAKLWKPYYRFEYIHIPRTDAVFQGVPNLAGSVAGVRYDISTFAAIKFEYRNQRRQAGQPRINSGFVQTSFTF
ncbi:MAG: hypothetical protein HY646_21755 [Acidobacteria bacterium]|nr:hypothetical protein [Acidobacteriota bacterium]